LHAETIIATPTTIAGGNSGYDPLEDAYPIHLSSKDPIAIMRIVIASDHAALEMKSALTDWLRESGYEVEDLGPFDDRRVDYPDYGYALASAISSGAAERGVALCGSGIGISIAVNRNPECRCARVDDPLSAQLAREHNDANVIALGARLIGIDMAKSCLSAFLSTSFGEGRHGPRVEKLAHPPFLKEPA
jgi:ribose 5-phosphate isomerase B